jgi:hypothetical protein
LTTRALLSSDTAGNVSDDVYSKAASFVGRYLPELKDPIAARVKELQNANELNSENISDFDKQIANIVSQVEDSDFDEADKLGFAEAIKKDLASQQLNVVGDFIIDGNGMSVGTTLSEEDMAKLNKNIKRLLDYQIDLNQGNSKAVEALQKIKSDSLSGIAKYISEYAPDVSDKIVNFDFENQEASVGYLSLMMRNVASFLSKDPSDELKEKRAKAFSGQLVSIQKMQDKADAQQASQEEQSSAELKGENINTVDFDKLVNQYKSSPPVGFWTRKMLGTGKKGMIGDSSKTAQNNGRLLKDYIGDDQKFYAYQVALGNIKKEDALKLLGATGETPKPAEPAAQQSQPPMNLAISEEPADAGEQKPAQAKTPVQAAEEAKKAPLVLEAAHRVDEKRVMFQSKRAAKARENSLLGDVIPDEPSEEEILSQGWVNQTKTVEAVMTNPFKAIETNGGDNQPLQSQKLSGADEWDVYIAKQKQKRNFNDPLQSKPEEDTEQISFKRTKKGDPRIDRKKAGRLHTENKTRGRRGPFRRIGPA